MTRIHSSQARFVSSKLASSGPSHIQSESKSRSQSRKRFDCTELSFYLDPCLLSFELDLLPHSDVIQRSCLEPSCSKPLLLSTLLPGSSVPTAIAKKLQTHGTPLCKSARRSVTVFKHHAYVFSSLCLLLFSSGSPQKDVLPPRAADPQAQCTLADNQDCLHLWSVYSTLRAWLLTCVALRWH